MPRAPRYHATGDCIHADPLAVIFPAGRTFSVYASDDIEMNGLVSGVRIGLIFYDNDRELFLNDPLFSGDLLASHPTPIHLAVVNEFARIRAWPELHAFFVKLDKMIVVDRLKESFKHCLDSEAGRTLYFAPRAEAFCIEEGIPLGKNELSSDTGFEQLVSAISHLPSLKHGTFCNAIPDIHRPAPDAVLFGSGDALRAERWIKLNTRWSSRKGELPPAVEQLVNREGLQKRELLREIVASYMHEVENWEGSPLMTLKDDLSMSRRDAEEYLLDSQVVHCPSPLGFTPRLRISFPAPEALALEPLLVKIAFVSELEKRVSAKVGFQVKVLYLPERHRFLLESICEGGREKSMAYRDSQDFERGVVFASNDHLASMVQAVDALHAAVGPAEAATAQETEGDGPEQEM
jgi:hypothetical protein